MAEEIVAQVELDLARDADHDPAGEKLKDSFAERNGDQQPAPRQQLAVSNAAVHVVRDALDNARGLDHDSVGAKHGEGSGYESLPIPLHVGE